MRRCSRHKLAVTALLALVLSCCGACSSSPGATALSGGDRGGGTFGIAALRPGMELGLLDVLLHNGSKQPLTIDSITVPGQGVGTVLQVVSIKIAPFPFPGGAFNTDPPVRRIEGRCIEEALKPVSGYRMQPGASAKVYVLVRAGSPGRYRITHHVVHYTEQGTRFSQNFTTGYSGAVDRTAASQPADPSQVGCLKVTGARLLP